jgi:hypothetical protein
MHAPSPNLRCLMATTLVACGHTTAPPAAASQGATTHVAADDMKIRCEPQGNAVTTGTISDDVPVIALFERDTWHSGFDVPSLLVWTDGTVVFSEGTYGESLHLLQSTTTTSQVREIANSVSQRLRDAPADTEITKWTDAPSVQIIFRDGEVWRVVEVYGLTRDVGTIPDAVRDVRAAYHQLLAWRPSGGVPAPTTYRRPPRWPDSLPTYRGQMVIDQLAFCAYRRTLPDRG